MEKSEIGTNIDKLVIILDTNILLYLYKCSFNASQNIVELFSKVKEKVVLYNGKTLDKDDNGVIYLNASEFLEELKVYDRNYLYNKNGITDGNEDNDAVNISIEDDFEDRDI